MGIATFKLARTAHGERNMVETWEEQLLQEEAKGLRCVMIPGLDAATAWAMVKTNAGVRVPVDTRKRVTADGIVFEEEQHISIEVVSAKTMRERNLGFENELLRRSGKPEGVASAAELQEVADLARASVGFAVFMHESWKKLPHIVRYFDLIEKNEAPDTPLLEWLIMVGAVDTESAKATVKRFKNIVKSGRTPLVLDEEDIMRIKAAVDVRLQLEADEEAKRREIETGS